jgi:hypothetical protein
MIWRLVRPSLLAATGALAIGSALALPSSSAQAQVVWVVPGFLGPNALPTLPVEDPSVGRNVLVQVEGIFQFKDQATDRSFSPCFRVEIPFREVASIIVDGTPVEFLQASPHTQVATRAANASGTTKRDLRFGAKFTIVRETECVFGFEIPYLAGPKDRAREAWAKQPRVRRDRSLPLLLPVHLHHDHRDGAVAGYASRYLRTGAGPGIAPTGAWDALQWERSGNRTRWLRASPRDRFPEEHMSRVRAPSARKGRHPSRGDTDLRPLGCRSGCTRRRCPVMQGVLTRPAAYPATSFGLRAFRAAALVSARRRRFSSSFRNIGKSPSSMSRMPASPGIDVGS